MPGGERLDGTGTIVRSTSVGRIGSLDNDGVEPGSYDRRTVSVDADECGRVE